LAKPKPLDAKFAVCIANLSGWRARIALCRRPAGSVAVVVGGLQQRCTADMVSVPDVGGYPHGLPPGQGNPDGGLSRVSTIPVVTVTRYGVPSGRPLTEPNL
jgi:hypothetical protein